MARQEQSGCQQTTNVQILCHVYTVHRPCRHFPHVSDDIGSAPKYTFLLVAGKSHVETQNVSIFKTTFHPSVCTLSLSSGTSKCQGAKVLGAGDRVGVQQTLGQQKKTATDAEGCSTPDSLWPKTWLRQTQPEEPKAPAAQNPLIGGLMMRCLKNGS